MNRGIQRGAVKRRGALARRGLPVVVALLTLLGGLTAALPYASSVAPSAPLHGANVVSSAAVQPGLTPAAGDWTTYLGSVARTSSGTGESLLGVGTAKNLTLLWTHAVGAGVVAQPIEVNGVLYFGSEDGYENAVSASTGAPIWRTYIGQTSGSPTGCASTYGVSSTATYLAGDLYVGGGDTDWYALSATTGQVLWKVFVGNNSQGPGGGNYNWASPLVVGGYAYVGVASECDKPLVFGGLLKVSLKTHNIVGRFNTTPPGTIGASIWSSPAYDAGSNSVFVTTGNGLANDSLAEAILQLNATTLRLESSWTVTPTLRVGDGDFGSTPTLFTDSSGRKLVAATNKDGLTYAWLRDEVGDGPVWSHRISSTASVASAAFGKGLLFVDGSTTTIGTTSYGGAVRALSSATGAFRWQVGWTSEVFAAPTYANGLLAVAGGIQFDVLAAGTGHVLFQFHGSPAGYQSPPTIAHDRVYLGSTSGMLRAFGLPPTVSVSASPSSGFAPLTSTFTLRAVGGTPPYRIGWVFGDGGGSSNVSPTHQFSAAGSYDVRVLLTDADNLTTSGNLTVTAFAGAASVVAVANVTGGPGPLSVGLRALLTGGNGPFAYRWVFGDGNVSTESAPDHVFSDPGDYGVELEVTDHLGLESYANTTVEVWGPAPSVEIAANGTTGVAPFAVGFSGSLVAGGPVVDFAWSFGDGSLTVGTEVSHVYSTPGLYLVSLNATDGHGEVGFASVEVRVYTPAPTVALTLNSSTCLAPCRVTLTAQVAGGNAPFNETWSLGDGSVAFGSTLTHLYANPGVYAVSVAVVDAAALAATAQLNLTVDAPPPVVAISANGSRGLAPLPLAFAANITGGNPPFTENWSFGDGDFGSGASVLHEFLFPGMYSVRLSVVDAAGFGANSTLEVAAYAPPPLVVVSASPSVGTTPLVVAFAANITGGNAPFVLNWSFGDGSGSNASAPDHTYFAAGSYNVSLEVADASGAVVAANTTEVIEPAGGGGNSTNGTHSSNGSGNGTGDDRPEAPVARAESTALPAARYDRSARPRA